MHATRITTTIILLIAVYIVLIFFPVSKVDDATYFTLFKQRITNPDEGINLFQSILLFIPFICLGMTTFYFLSFLTNKEVKHLEKTRWFSLTTFLAFVTLNILVATEIIGDKNLSFLIGIFPFLLLSFSNQIELATGRTKVWFKNSEENPSKEWYSSRAITYFVWGSIALYVFFVITAKMGCNLGDNESTYESYKNTTFTQVFYNFPNFLFGSILIYFGFVVYLIIGLKIKSLKEKNKRDNKSNNQTQT